MSFKAILWDFGGVLTSSPFDAFSRYETEHGLPVDFIRGVNARNLHENAWAQFESSRCTLEEFDQLFAINVKGSFNAMREAAQRLQPGGRIVNFSSSLVGTALPGYSVYAGGKAAIETMTLVLARELRGKAITVNAVAPGPTATALFLDGKTPELIARLAQAAPLERLGTPEDIANVVAFLVGEQGGWINGQTLRANGGMV